MTTTIHHMPVYGHDWAADYLRRGILHARVRHAYLITGPESVGKSTLARAFALTLQCTHPEPEQRPCLQCRSCKLIQSGSHPDIIYSRLDPDTRALKIEEIRAVASKLALKPFEGRFRIAIFSDFERAQPRAQDALLKTLEEPPGQAILILLASSPDAILPTIISRCQNIHLTLLPAATVRDVLVEQYQADATKAEQLARLSGGRLGWAIHALQEPDILTSRTEALDLLETILKQNRVERFELAEKLSKDKLALTPLLELWQTYWRDVLLMVEGTDLPPMNIDREPLLREIANDLKPEQALSALKATQEMLSHLTRNVNVRLALEVMFLDYPK